MARPEHVSHFQAQERPASIYSTPWTTSATGARFYRAARSSPAPPAHSITVVLPHRGCESYLHAAARSILEQTVRDLHLVIVDDASPTNAWIDALGRLRKDPRLTLLQTSTKVGPYRIANAVIPRITTSLVAFQDADDISAPTRLARQLELMRSSRADIVGCSFECVDEAGRRLRSWRMGRFGNLRHWLGMNFLAHHPTTIVSREALSLLGGYDGTTCFGADSDFLIRAAYLLRIRNCREMLYQYRQRRDSLTGSRDTGFGSAARRNYRNALMERKCVWNQIRDRPALVCALQARPNDMSFELHTVDGTTDGRAGALLPASTVVGTAMVS